MGDGNSLINLGDLSKPATVLVEKISDAIGAIYEPRHIKNVATAEAEAEKIKTVAQIEISEIQQRALIRRIEEEEKYQENIEKITSESIKQLDDEAKPEGIDNDWIVNFFDKCKLVSDNEMQSLWSSILAGEANEPGSYSKRTIALISNLDKKDAQLFTEFCVSCFYSGFDGEIFPIVFNVTDEIYNKHNINHKTVSHLEDIGLVKFNEITAFIYKNIPKKATCLYYGNKLIIEFPNEENNNLLRGKVNLTSIGQELARICGAKGDLELLDYVIQEWGKIKIKVTIEKK